MGSISRLAEKCKKCPHMEYCNDKRMEACAFIEMPEKASINCTAPFTSSLMAPVARTHNPIIINMGNYGTLNTSLEDIQKKLAKRFYENAFNINCNFNRR